MVFENLIRNLGSGIFWRNLKKIIFKNKIIKRLAIFSPFSRNRLLKIRKNSKKFLNYRKIVRAPELYFVHVSLFIPSILTPTLSERICEYRLLIFRENFKANKFRNTTNVNLSSLTLTFNSSFEYKYESYYMTHLQK